MSRQTLSPKRKAIDNECDSRRRETSEPLCQSEQPCQSEPPWQLTLAVREPSFLIKLKDEYVEPEHEELVRLTLSTGSSSPPERLPALAVHEPSFIIKLKNEYVEPEYEELVRLTLSIGSSYPSPPERLPASPLPESLPHPSLLRLRPPSSSSTCSLQPPPESLSHLSFSQLLSQFPSPPGFPALPSSQSSPQNGILTVQPPPLPEIHPSLFMPSYSSQYIKPPPGLVSQSELELWQQSQPSERKQKPPAEQKEEPPVEQKQKPPAEHEPSFIIKLKNEYVEPEHEELVRLTLSTGSSYPSPPERLPASPLPESLPPPSLLRLRPPSSSSTCSLQPPPKSLSHLSFSQLLCQFPSPPGFPALPSSQSSPQNGILTVQPPPLPEIHPSLFMPSYSSQYIKPLPGLVFLSELELRQQSQPSERKQKPPAEQKQEPPIEQKQKPPSELKQEQPAEKKQEPPVEQKQKPPAEGQARYRRPRNYKKPGWTATIEPPYPWATSSRAKVLSMEELLSQNITKIKGDLCCKECKKQFEIEYDLGSNFSEVVSFITENLNGMHDRAPPVWLKPEDLDCEYCNKTKCVQPLLPKLNRETNWLFLFLGQLIGHCNLTHLKHFCKHTDHHRTAAKDRLVYLTYTTLHLQLDPKAAELYEEVRVIFRFFFSAF
ncbi:hypothetical protein K1719_002513 [Acacia pycnantha]|nr:hypothetical protein K1719_002513 [Acacia pycnantha]